MKNFKELFTYLIILTFLSSCGTIKEGFSNQKKDNKDEFLVEKKNPLKMPPDFEKLPVPTSEIGTNGDQKKQELQKLITKKENKSNETVNSTNANNNFKEFLLDKIKNN